MATLVHARLDPKTEHALSQLRRKLGLTDSAIIREAIRVLATTTIKPVRSRIIGMGAFESGISDLGSNKKHLKGFGK
jgi:hypothetical protein